MAQKRRATTRKRPARKSTPRKRPAKKVNHTLNWLGAAFLVVGLLATFQLGIMGVFLANVFRLVVGDLYLVATVGFSALGLWLLMSGKLPLIATRILVGTGVLAISVLTLLSVQLFDTLNIHSHYVIATWHLLQNDFMVMATSTRVGGGMLGGVLSGFLLPLIAPIGTRLAASLGILISGLCFFNVSPQQLFQFLGRCGQGLVRGWQGVINGFATLPKPERKPKPKTQSKLKPKPVASVMPEPEASAPDTADTVADDAFTIHTAKPDTPSTPAPVKRTTEPEPEADDKATAIPSLADPQADAYQLPDIDLLTPTPPVDQKDEYDIIKHNRQILGQTFSSFGVDVTVKSATLGPAITQYEIQPAIGVKVSKIVNLADDLALAMAAKDIRIEAPIPGKSLIGIEVPNRQVAMVGYREVLAATPSHPDKPLVIPLGKDLNGQVVTFDLTKMPHLLIAGATGSGKSVVINVIITSILMTTKPSDVRLMLIDPKKVELSVYNGVPHLLTPVVTEAKKAPSALNNVIREMESRYERFAAGGVRNVTEYNKKVAESDDPTLTKMPYIVVIVDELSDLMMVAGAEVETAIVRLAQMARAAGIHVIIATQRPSVDVITGLIKANIPSRIAFAVSSGIDSRTILDANGAEKLLGRGDMLYQPIDANKPVRIQGAYIDSADVEAVVQAITKQVEPAYEEEMEPSDQVETSENGSSEDEYYEDAVAFVIQEQKASTSLLQRHFRIGYNRAARLIDDLEDHGIIGKSEGSKPRKVYATHVPGDPNQPAD
ncbi:DNA translocase FtsK [Lacticaseibacillus saniviri]|nr:DNA translocase FtsK [Lacticaseibacillus saniviri]MCG4281758.1 DNA translocase FtsK [Lacticaseibacillus saniviri]